MSFIGIHWTSLQGGEEEPAKINRWFQNATKRYARLLGCPVRSHRSLFLPVSQNSLNNHVRGIIVQNYEYVCEG